MKKIFDLLIAFSGICITISCSHSPDIINHQLFTKLTDNPLNDSLFFCSSKIEHKGSSPYNKYEISLRYWDECPVSASYSPEHVIHCYLFLKNDSIFVENQKTGKEVYLFSLGRYEKNRGLIDLKVDLTYVSPHLPPTGVMEKVIYQRFEFYVQDAFYSVNYKSDIYKIRLFDYPYFNGAIYGSDDLVLFLSADSGILGAYLAYSSSDHYTPSIDSIETFTGDIFRARYDSCCIYYLEKGEWL